jgi:hypothetical protein
MPNPITRLLTVNIMLYLLLISIFFDGNGEIGNVYKFMFRQSYPISFFVITQHTDVPNQEDRNVAVH